MAYLTPELKKELFSKASIPDLNSIRNQFRHIIPIRDLRWLDALIKEKSNELVTYRQT